MEPQAEYQEPTPILQIAWMRYAQLSAYSRKRKKANLNLRRWVTILGIVATFLALVVTTVPSEASLLNTILRFFLVLTPIVASALAAYGTKFLASGDWLVSRAGAEEVLKEIYIYRTVLQNEKNRNNWLENRLAEIQRSVYRGMNGELIIPPYEGKIPPHYSPDDPSTDAGYHDINGDDYLKYRLESQLKWHINKVSEAQQGRVRLQVLILLSGVAGALLAVFLPLWTALAASFTAAFIGWQELRNYDLTIRNYSKVVMELEILYNHWHNLSYEDKNTTEFFKLVRSAEEILWGQNVEYIKAMQEALKDKDLEEEAGLVNRVIKEARESDRRLKQSLEDSVIDFTTGKLYEANESLSETFEDALNTLAKEASSEIVRAELAAMRDAIQEFSQKIAEKLGLSSSLEQIAEDYQEIEVGQNTPRPVINELLSRYPKTSEVKG
ncbi:MAG: SLATT domain-containing protein [Anaerolineales bacterium]|nr:SLATT domain-containing protein [Anaerolineales bacterium]